MRLFRQHALGDWDTVFKRMTNELRQLIAKQERTGTVTVEIAPGELIDKLTILQIKSERITDAAKLAHVHAELAALESARARSVPSSPDLGSQIRPHPATGLLSPGGCVQGRLRRIRLAEAVRARPVAHHS
jgi:hypothetical protein